MRNIDIEKMYHFGPHDTNASGNSKKTMYKVDNDDGTLL